MTDSVPQTSCSNHYYISSGIAKFNITWNIPNFTKIRKVYLKNLNLKSLPFEDKNLSGLFWEIHLSDGNYHEELKLSLRLNSKNAESNVTAGILSISTTMNNSTVKQFENICVLSNNEFITALNLAGHKSTLDNDSLTILLEIKYALNENKHNFISSSMTSDTLDGDCTIICGDKKLMVIKFRLTLFSPVFKAMFSNKNTSESKTNCIVISDSSIEEVGYMVYFCYNLKLPQNLSVEDFTKLLKLADKYEIKLLKFKCEEILMDEISNDNVCDFLELADTYHSKILKEKCIKKIKQSFLIVSNDEKFLHLRKNSPKLINEVYEFIFLKNKSHKIE
ncbi:Speckle-type POZ protein [Strongyloides ratti]|uniref:Speckle-type POZ protein n=1 Tax=Strongyloides ratti TaxID=34506 RepID=A0A090MYC5_STRRB|nr:Speckle-type POZ protein [Strongyloides ratti]CEF66944.1 Speckle-type POZ protein [Strongyloides ratti]